MLRLIKQGIYNGAILVLFFFPIYWCGMCQGNTMDDVIRSEKHISWIASQPSSNYSTVCDDSPDVFSCFSEYYKSSVFFYLFNRGRNGSEILRLGDIEQLRLSPFKSEAPIKFIIHGYKMTGFSQFSHLVKEAYMDYGNETNVIVVDWRWLASEHIYFHSAFNTRIVGERVGEFIVYLKKTKFIKSYKQIHLIGFSLGAHVAGYAGKHIQKTSNEKISRITGLDPAGPSFTNTGPSSRLDLSDAMFVDIIHTCVGRSGIVESIGHVDFFPNGGIDQPGCEWERLHSFFLKNCSHERAYQFFLESIKGEKYVGCDCSKWDEFRTGNCRCNENTKGAELMGENCSFKARGDKYLATTSDNHLRISV